MREFCARYWRGATPARLQRLSLYLQFEVAGPTGKGGRGAPLTWST
jgi:hypothetical protein